MLVLQIIIAIAQVKNLSSAFDLNVEAGGFVSEDAAYDQWQEAGRLSALLRWGIEELDGLPHLRAAAIEARDRAARIAAICEIECVFFGK